MQENGRNLSIFFHLPCPAGVAKLISKHGIIRKCPLCSYVLNNGFSSRLTVVRFISHYSGNCFSL